MRSSLRCCFCYWPCPQHFFLSGALWVCLLFTLRCIMTEKPSWIELSWSGAQTPKDFIIFVIVPADYGLAQVTHQGKCQHLKWKTLPFLRSHKDQPEDGFVVIKDYITTNYWKKKISLSFLVPSHSLVWTKAIQSKSHSVFKSTLKWGNTPNKVILVSTFGIKEKLKRHAEGQEK